LTKDIIQNYSRRIPKGITFDVQKTKFPSIDDKVKQMMTDRDEALAAHKLARTRTKHIHTVHCWTKGLVGHSKHKDELSQENDT
jgi:hypothetical protein